jgi:hypothetical protein
MAGNVERICALPVTYKNGNKSPLELLREAECFTSADIPPISDIKAFLNSNPDLVRAWWIWSGDKRVDSGWYLEQLDSGYVVGFYPRGKTFKFVAALDACAEFIVREIKDLLPAQRRI